MSFPFRVLLLKRPPLYAANDGRGSGTADGVTRQKRADFVPAFLLTRFGENAWPGRELAVFLVRAIAT